MFLKIPITGIFLCETQKPLTALYGILNCNIVHEISFVQQRLPISPYFHLFLPGSLWLTDPPID